MKKTRAILIATPILLFLMIFVIISILFYRIRPITYEIQGLERSNLIKLQVKNNTGKLESLKTIDDPETIHLIVSTINSYSENWQYDEFAPPYTGSLGKPHPLWLVFYRDGQKQVVLTIGYSTDETYSIQEVYGPGRYLKKQEFGKLMDLLNIDRKYAIY